MMVELNLMEKKIMYEVTSSSDANKILDIKIQRTHHVPIIVFNKKKCDIEKDIR